MDFNQSNQNDNHNIEKIRISCNADLFSIIDLLHHMIDECGKFIATNNLIDDKKMEVCMQFRSIANKYWYSILERDLNYNIEEKVVMKGRKVFDEFQRVSKNKFNELMKAGINRNK